MMAHYPWMTPDRVLRMTPAQLVYAWAAWQTDQTKRLRDTAIANRIAGASVKDWKKVMKDLET